MKAVYYTKLWLKKVVIDLVLCPFAKIPFENNLIRFAATTSTTDELMLDFFIDELALIELNLRTDLSTSLVIYPEYQGSFAKFNQFSKLCDDYLVAAKIDDLYQIVVFHPGFYFKYSKKKDRANSVGQSPYPTLHILRNIEIDEAMDSYANVNEIPERNRQRIRGLSKEKWEKLQSYRPSGRD